MDLAANKSSNRLNSCKQGDWILIPKSYIDDVGCVYEVLWLEGKIQYKHKILLKIVYPAHMSDETFSLNLADKDIISLGNPKHNKLIRLLYS